MRCLRAKGFVFHWGIPVALCGCPGHTHGKSGFQVPQGMLCLKWLLRSLLQGKFFASLMLKHHPVDLSPSVSEFPGRGSSLLNRIGMKCPHPTISKCPRDAEIWNYSWARATPEKAVSESWKVDEIVSPLLSSMCGTFQHVREHRFSPKTGIILKNEFLLELKGTEANSIQPKYLCCNRNGVRTFIICLLTHTHAHFPAGIPAPSLLPCLQQRDAVTEVAACPPASNALSLSPGW